MCVFVHASDLKVLEQVRLLMDILKFQQQLSRKTALLLRNVESMPVIFKSDETVRVSDYHILADNVRWLGFDVGSISAVSKAAFLFD